MRRLNKNQRNRFLRNIESGNLSEMLKEMMSFTSDMVKETQVIFIVQPNGDITEIHEENEEEKTTSCPDCNGDGYIVCGDCSGQGYTIAHNPIGQKNAIKECETCGGTGDIICGLCKGSGVVTINEDNDEIDREMINSAIQQLFEQNTHNTIIGPITLEIHDIRYGDDKIYVIPTVFHGSLITDDNFQVELSKLYDMFDLKKIIEIPSIYYASNR